MSKMKTVFSVFLLTGLLVAPTFAATRFSVVLDEGQASAGAGTGSAAMGSGELLLEAIGGGDYRLSYTLHFSADLDFSGVAGVASNGANSSVTAFHIHNQDRGANGGVVYGMFSPSHDRDGGIAAVLNADGTTTITGAWDPADGNPAGNLNTYATTGFTDGNPTSLLDMAPGEEAPLYFNVHTSVVGSGEIRGQIVAVPEPTAISLAGIALVALFGGRRRRVREACRG